LKLTHLAHDYVILLHSVPAMGSAELPLQDRCVDLNYRAGFFLQGHTRGANMFGPQNPPPDEDNQGQNGQEISRRQHMMRFGLLMLLLFLLLDNNNKQQPGNHDGGRRPSEENPDYAEIPLNAVYASKMKSILGADPVHYNSQRSMNTTGLFRGTWRHTHPPVNGSGRVT
jgi:hypothetical protein